LRACSLSAGQPVPDAQHNDFDLVQSVAHKSSKVGGNGSLALISRIEARTLERYPNATQHLSHRFATFSATDVFGFVIVDASYFFSYVA
jgi:hypothetical protein